MSDHFRLSISRNDRDGGTVANFSIGITLTDAQSRHLERLKSAFTSAQWFETYDTILILRQIEALSPDEQEAISEGLAGIELTAFSYQLQGVHVRRSKRQAEIWLDCMENPTIASLQAPIDALLRPIIGSKMPPRMKAGVWLGRVNLSDAEIARYLESVWMFQAPLFEAERLVFASHHATSKHLVTEILAEYDCRQKPL